MQVLGQGFGVGLDGEIERRLVPVGGGDGVRGLGAIGLAPAREQPGRRVAFGIVGRRAGAVLRHAPQHGIDQAGIARGAPVGLRQPHREIDRGVVGHLEPEDLHGADQQYGFDARRIARETLVEIAAEQMAQRAEPAQRGGGEPPHQRAVAFGQRRQARMGALAGELFVERDAPPQHAVENVGGDPARAKAGHFGLRGAARTRHDSQVLRGKCVPVAKELAENAADSQAFAGLPGAGPRLRKNLKSTSDCTCANRNLYLCLGRCSLR